MGRKSQHTDVAVMSALLIQLPTPDSPLPAPEMSFVGAAHMTAPSALRSICVDLFEDLLASPGPKGTYFGNVGANPLNTIGSSYTAIASK